MSRIDNNSLVHAGLEIMQKSGKPLTRLPSKGRAMLYEMPNKQIVRVRTCNDHVLIVVADRPTLDAKLNIEGTDWLLIIMPEIERKPGKVIAYLVPTSVAIEEARRTHEKWLKLNPKTKGDNRTWNLWFQIDGPGKSNIYRANGYAEKWRKYLLKPTAAAKNDGALGKQESPTSSFNVKAEVENARRRIAQTAGVPIEAVKVSIDFS